jgi:hypothetical protein
MCLSSTLQLCDCLGQVNGIYQATEMSSDLQSALEAANMVFLGFFTLEMFIKLIGLGPAGYITSVLNVFDCVTVIVGFVELTFAGSSSITAVN